MEDGKGEERFAVAQEVARVRVEVEDQKGRANWDPQEGVAHDKLKAERDEP